MIIELCPKCDPEHQAGRETVKTFNEQNEFVWSEIICSEHKISLTGRLYPNVVYA